MKKSLSLLLCLNCYMKHPENIGHQTKITSLKEIVRNQIDKSLTSNDTNYQEALAIAILESPFSETYIELLLADDTAHFLTSTRLRELFKTRIKDQITTTATLGYYSKSIYLEMIKYLARKGLRIDVELFLAAEENNYQLLNILVRAGAKLNIQNLDGSTALMYACSFGNREIVSTLIDAGANIDTQDDEGESAIMWACIYGNEKIAAYLFGYGANMNLQNIDGETALIRACRRGNQKIALALIGAGANTDFQNNMGDTALIYAARSGYKEIVLALINAGTNVGIQNLDGSTALIIAYRFRNKEIITALLNAHARELENSV